ncbi:MAG: hypothetical protein HQL50_05065 [Magnetococcales bacterium]|nr:hypothetical protein [Magnetococcales bacterium]
MKWQAGWSAHCITPHEPLDLAGLGGGRCSQSIVDDLHVKVIALRSGEQTLLLITFDLLWLSEELCSRVREHVRTRFTIPPEQILISATHTHSGPLVRESVFDGTRHAHAYEQALLHDTTQAIESAMTALRPVTIRYAHTPLEKAINRRRRVLSLSALKRFRFSYDIFNRPNPEGSNDPTLGVVHLRDRDGQSAYLINWACHPTLLRGTDISADFPGWIAPAIGQGGAEPFVLFQQGFSGNIRADVRRTLPHPGLSPVRWLERLCDPIQFEKSTSLDHVKSLAGSIAASIREITDWTPLDEGAISGDLLTVSLPMAPYPKHSELEKWVEQGDSVKAAWAKETLDHYEERKTLTMRIQRLSLGSTLHWVGAEGELFADYALWLRQHYQTADGLLFPVGCCERTLGYIPTAVAIHEGGYEPLRSVVMYGLPCPFDPIIEEKIKEKMALLMTP